MTNPNKFKQPPIFETQGESGELKLPQALRGQNCFCVIRMKAEAQLPSFRFLKQTAMKKIYIQTKKSTSSNGLNHATSSETVFNRKMATHQDGVANPPAHPRPTGFLESRSALATSLPSNGDTRPLGGYLGVTWGLFGGYLGVTRGGGQPSRARWLTIQSPRVSCRSRRPWRS